MVDKKEAETFGKGFTEGALSTAGKWLIIASVGVWGWHQLSNAAGWSSTDATDRSVYQRSGLKLRTDYGTGCQYLESHEGHLSPRIGRDGRQVCQ